MRDCSYCNDILSPNYTQDQINNLRYNNFLGFDRNQCDKNDESIRRYKSYVAYLFDLYFPNSLNNTTASNQNQSVISYPNSSQNLSTSSNTNLNSNQYPNQNYNNNSSQTPTTNTGTNTGSNQYPNQNYNTTSNTNPTQSSSNTGTSTDTNTNTIPNQYPNQSPNSVSNQPNSDTSYGTSPNVGTNLNSFSNQYQQQIGQTPTNSQLDGTNTIITDFLIGTNDFTVFESLSDEEIQLIMKYKERVDNYFDAMIPSIYLSGIEENSVYYIDSQGNLVNESSSSLFIYIIKLIKVYLVALYVYIDYVLNIQDVSENRMNLLLNLVKSFGCYNQLLTLPAPILMNFLYNIIAIYRNKGSAYSLKLFIENVLRRKDRILEGYMYSAYDYSTNSIKLFVDFRDPFTLELVQTKYADELGLRGNFVNNDTYSLFSG